MSQQQTPQQTLNKAFIKQTISIELFKAFQEQIKALCDSSERNESEEHHKNRLAQFFRETQFGLDYDINTSGRIDLVIRTGSEETTPMGVMIEAKLASNKAEMPTPDNLNKKALQQLLLYYLRQRVTENNLELKQLIVTNNLQWIIFDATTFERLVAQNKPLVKQFEQYRDGQLSGTTTDFFYDEIASPFLDKLKDDPLFTYTTVNLQEHDWDVDQASLDPKQRREQIALYRLFSPQHLLKLPIANDSNTLNKAFYTELLHLIGLTEVMEGNRKLIRRKRAGERDDGSLLESAIFKIGRRLHEVESIAQYGATDEEKLFTIGLELTITWINRILFLKLLEAQLLTYGRLDGFLNRQKLEDFDDFDTLFFEVLAIPAEERNHRTDDQFGGVPYLNSSLFERTALERQLVTMGNLKLKDIAVHSQTVLKDRDGKKRVGRMPFHAYLFDFLDAYDFGRDTNSDVLVQESKTLINASVLGLIFEKINGYKDGSIFTPGQITMYMCRETLRNVVVQKFNTVKGWDCTTLDEVEDALGSKKADRDEANEIMNGLRICDPAVGSGHFLVSALNELITIKQELKILQDADGKRLKQYEIIVENDELLITDEDGELFQYRPNHSESSRIQKTLFHEKQTLIESCLFGVDINLNSVKICRLRLWIELLKNAYFKSDTELETLPNIDINIKHGNSLISRFDLDADLSVALKENQWTIENYQNAVNTYRNAETKEEKREMEGLIRSIKGNLRQELKDRDRDVLDLVKVKGELERLLGQTSLLEETKAIQKKRESKRKTLARKIDRLEDNIAEKQDNRRYKGAFEWRFEFPEVLDESGAFVGFDVVIGNPPYVRHELITEMKPTLKQNFGTVYAGTADIYVYFYARGVDLLKRDGTLAYITSNKFMRAGYGKKLRTLLTKETTLRHLIDFGDLPVFDATAYPTIVITKTTPPPPETEVAALTVDSLDILHQLPQEVDNLAWPMPQTALPPSGWALVEPDVLALMNKLRHAGQPLEKYVDGKFYRGILTGFNEAFVIDAETRDQLIAEDPHSEEIIKPWLRGRDIKRWQVNWKNLYVIFTRRGIDIEEYPAIKKYLLQFKKNLMPKPKNWDENRDGKWSGRKPGPYKWYEIQDNIQYHEEFQKPKIIYPDIAKRPEFTIDNSESFGGNTLYIIPTTEVFLLAILNSPVMHFFYDNISSTVRGGYFRFIATYMKYIPIPILNTSDKQIINQKVQQLLDAKGQGEQVAVWEHQLNALVYDLYGLSDDEIALIETTIKRGK